MGKKSGHNISAFVNKGILEITMTGELIESNVERLQNEVAAIIKAKGVAILLVDIRDLDGRFMLESAYWQVRRPLPDGPKVNIAVLDYPDNSDFISSFESLAIDAGLPIKCFTDIDAARDWLKSKQRMRNKS